jgi:hypothetical protein
MSATAGEGATTGPTAPTPPADAAADADADRAYFLAIEDYFVKLRGAPLLLSPVDWHVARRWRLTGVPLELVRRSLEEVFARRRERGAKGRISSLRYCASAVEAAWAAHAEMAAPGARGEAEPFDAAARLAALVAAVTSGASGASGAAGPEVAGLPARLAELAAAGLDAPTLEERLAELDRETLDRALAALPADARDGLGATVEKAIASLAGRLPPAELDRARERLARQVLRDRLGLPVLSLFSLEAQPPEPAP